MFELIKIGFLSVNFLDLVDIAIVAFILYKLYSLLKGTIASQIFIGLIVVLILSFTAQAINLKALSWLLKFVTDIWIIAFIILFQPEIRRLLVILGRNPLLRLQFKVDETYASIIADAAFEMSQHQHGALIVVIKSAGIRGFKPKKFLFLLQKQLIRQCFLPLFSAKDFHGVCQLFFC